MALQLDIIHTHILQNYRFSSSNPSSLPTDNITRITEDKEGNIWDYANIVQLVVLSNTESINAVLIRQGLSQSDRLMQLNKIAITQMTSLMKSNQLKKLK